jgi:hypothetical protein
VELVLEPVVLGAQGALPFAQRGCPGAQLLEREELFLVGLDEAGEGRVGAVKVALERLAPAGGGVLAARSASRRRSISARTSAGSSSSRRTSPQTSPSSSSARIGRLWQTRPPTWR